MNNCKFLQYPHSCVVCNSQIDMEKVERYVYNCMRYANNEPELMEPRIEGQPIVVRDYGNDVDIVCSEICLFRHLGLDFYYNE